MAIQVIKKPITILSLSEDTIFCEKGGTTTRIIITLSHPLFTPLRLNLTSYPVNHLLYAKGITVLEASDTDEGLFNSTRIRNSYFAACSIDFEEATLFF